VTCDMTWQVDAECTVAPELFFPPDGRESSKEAARRESLAKELCDVCPVRSQCLAHALTFREEAGVWGGMTTRERQELLTPMQHGALSGVDQHRRLGQRPCAQCRIWLAQHPEHRERGNS
jgi:WhiB family transcriptional regulator, redox-sensing transcriptional regulator